MGGIKPILRQATMGVGSGLSLFQEMHCTSLLLPLFVLIDKKIEAIFSSKKARPHF